MTLTLSNLFLIVAVVLFVVAGLNLQHFVHGISDVEVVSFGLAFFAASFLAAQSAWNNRTVR